MGRVVPLIVAVISLSAACGCGSGLGLYRSSGHLPGIAATDYAFYSFCGTSSQLYQFAPPQVESALMEALADLGFKVVEPPAHQKNGEELIRARTPDGRPTRITISPRNAMTNVAVTIGPGPLGDYELSADLLRRVALNFGTLKRAHTPLETTLPRRINLSSWDPSRIKHAPPEALQGEGLRPDQSRTETTGEEPAIPGSEGVPMNLPSPFQGFIPSSSFPNPPNMPYAPFPYTPFDNSPN